MASNRKSNHRDRSNDPSSWNHSVPHVCWQRGSLPHERTQPNFAGRHHSHSKPVGPSNQVGASHSHCVGLPSSYQQLGMWRPSHESSRGCDESCGSGSSTQHPVMESKVPATGSNIASLKRPANRPQCTRPKAVDAMLHHGNKSFFRDPAMSTQSCLADAERELETKHGGSCAGKKQVIHPNGTRPAANGKPKVFLCHCLVNGCNWRAQTHEALVGESTCQCTVLIKRGSNHSHPFETATLDGRGLSTDQKKIADDFTQREKTSEVEP